MGSAVMFGAGAIGRGFMGQMFAASGYAVTFVDIVAPLIAAFNGRGHYTLTLVDGITRQDVQVGPVRGLLSTDADAVTAALVTADVAATAVGARALQAVAPLIAGGVSRRMAQGEDRPLNVLVCENMSAAGRTLRDLIYSHLDPQAQAYADGHLGTAGVVVGRMVPEPTRELLANDLSAVLAEPYAEMPVDRDGLLGEPPDIVGLRAVSPFDAWIARKLYLHNAAHALMGYLGYRRGLQFGYESLVDPVVSPILAAAMGESEAGLAAAYGWEVGDLMEHAASLWPRVANRDLADPVRRLARDPLRKLAPGDRLVGPARAAEKVGILPDALAWGIAGALCFDAPGDASAQALQERVAAEGVAAVMESVCHISPDESLGELVLDRYARLERGELGRAG